MYCIYQGYSLWEQKDFKIVISIRTRTLASSCFSDTAMNKEVLINFLNALLLGKEVIKDVTYLNTEHLGTQEYDRRAVFDVYCENDRGEKILVEMQRGEQQFFKDRSIYYATFPIHEQAPRGEWDYELKGVYIIGILNFIFQDGIADSDHYHHQVQLVELRTKEVLYDKLNFIYLEMPKFNRDGGGTGNHLRQMDVCAPQLIQFTGKTACLAGTCLQQTVSSS